MPSATRPGRSSAGRQRRLVVEVDGGTDGTAEEIAKDTARAAFLQAQGYRVSRISNIDVCENLDGVVAGRLLGLARGEDL